MTSPLLATPGAVPADGIDEGVAAHYGDPYAEQRALAGRFGVVDRSNRGVLRITGADRLSWLHSLTTQDLERLAPGSAGEALVLSPQGHVEHHLTLTDDGSSTWIHVEPGEAASLLEFLASMRFMLRVDPQDVTADYGVLTVVGPDTPAGDLGGLRLDAGLGADLIVARSELTGVADRIRSAGGALAGMWAHEALRIAAGQPRLGLDTDHRTIPHEVGWIETAVHLTKGCYRGQETVARVHNLGRPPRRLVLLHLDGSEDKLPSHGADVMLDGVSAGLTGSTARHYELGPIALALVKRTTPVSATFTVDGIAAAQEVLVSPEAGANVQIDTGCRAGATSWAARADAGATARTPFPGGGFLVLRQALLALSASGPARDAIMATPATRSVVARFVAGETIDDALAATAGLAADGRLVTIDFLGEDTTDPAQATAVTDEYVRLLGRLCEAGLAASGRAEVSVKPTAVGLGLPGSGEKTALENIRRIASAARNAGTTVTVDMEDHTRV